MFREALAQIKLISTHKVKNKIKKIKKKKLFLGTCSDCCAGSTNSDLIREFEETVPTDLSNSNFDINTDKTENFSISHNGDEKWKDNILLGSKLDTNRDISLRTQLASAAWSKYKILLTNKTLPLLLRVKYFEVVISSIFLYQCGIWTLIKKN